MNYLNRILALFVLVTCLVSCEDEDPSFGSIVAPTNLTVSHEIVGQDADHPYGDGSGVVNFQASANNATSFRFLIPGTQVDATNGRASIQFSDQGVNTYQVTVLAFGTGGVSTSTVVEVEVQVDYSPPLELLQKLVGDGSKTWRIKSEKDKHFGLGPVGGTVPCEWYGAQPEEKVGVGMYDDRYIFSMNWNTMGDRVFTHITDNTNDDSSDPHSGTVFGRGGQIEELNGPGGEVQGGDILNYPLNDYNGSWQIIAPGGVETIALSGTSFIGYFSGGNHQYQIFDRAVPNELLLSTVDGNGEFTWWFVITDLEPGGDDGFTSIYNNLVWADEFDVDGAPNPDNWNYNLGAGGWGNNELQTYTSNSENIIIEDGLLKITAKKEGSNYTSARIKTENLFEFTYGRVEVRAKLPIGGGTWPAIWMLGADYETNTWPACGEIDIMEHVGNQQNTIHGTLHFPGNSGGNGVTGTTINPTASTEFHNYSLEWRPDEILFLVDDVVFHTFDNSTSVPFNSDFFIILNVAMGGNFGGVIDPDFEQSTMEVEYVRVYQ